MTRRKSVAHYWVSPPERWKELLPWPEEDPHDDLCGHSTDNIDGFTCVKAEVTCPNCKRILQQARKPKPKTKAKKVETSVAALLASCEVKNAEGKWVPAKDMPPGHYVMRFVDPKAEQPKETVEVPKETTQEVPLEQLIADLKKRKSPLAEVMEQVKTARALFGLKAESPKETVREVMQSTAAARAEKFDAVEKPAHYNQGGIECIDALKVATKGLDGIEAVCTANAIKYLWRWKLKNGVEDLKKARWYIDRLIKELTPSVHVDQLIKDFKAELKKP